jgi:hypothetical protein
LCLVLTESLPNTHSPCCRNEMSRVASCWDNALSMSLLLLLLLLLTIPHHYTIPYHTNLDLPLFLSTFITKNLLPPCTYPFDLEDTNTRWVGRNWVFCFDWFCLLAWGFQNDRDGDGHDEERPYERGRSSWLCRLYRIMYEDVEVK